MRPATKKKTATKKKSTMRQTTEKAASRRRVNYVPSDFEIRNRAYEIYVARGGEHGHDLEDWLKAESELNRN